MDRLWTNLRFNGADSCQLLKIAKNFTYTYRRKGTGAKIQTAFDQNSPLLVPDTSTDVPAIPPESVLRLVLPPWMGPQQASASLPDWPPPTTSSKASWLPEITWSAWTTSMGAPTGWVAQNSMMIYFISSRPSFKKSTLPHRYFRQIASKMGIEVSFVDMRTPENASAALKPNTKLVWIETPTNPTLKIVDIKAVSDLVHQQVGLLAQLFMSFSHIQLLL